MAKRSSKSKPSSKSTATSQTGPLERQVLAFAEQLGYVAGSIQARTEGLVDRKTLSRQVTSVRDGAKHLLEQLATGVASRVRRKPAPKRPVRKARSGGTVDAPGKAHRKPAPPDPLTIRARSQAAKMRNAPPRMKSVLPRVRG